MIEMLIGSIQAVKMSLNTTMIDKTRNNLK